MALDPDQSHTLSVFYIEGTITTVWLQEKFIPVQSCWRVNQREDMKPQSHTGDEGQYDSWCILEIAC